MESRGQQELIYPNHVGPDLELEFFVVGSFIREPSCRAQGIDLPHRTPVPAFSLPLSSAVGTSVLEFLFLTYHRSRLVSEK